MSLQARAATVVSPPIWNPIVMRHYARTALFLKGTDHSMIGALRAGLWKRRAGRTIAIVSAVAASALPVAGAAGVSGPAQASPGPAAVRLFTHRQNVNRSGQRLSGLGVMPVGFVLCGNRSRLGGCDLQRV